MTLVLRHHNRAKYLLRNHFLGKIFATVDEAKLYYEEYGKQKGFSIRTRCTTKGKQRSDEVTGATFVCSREGKLSRKGVYIEEQESMITEGSKEKNMKQKRLCSTVRIGCEAYMRVKMDYSTMRIMVTAFSYDHNHTLVTPQKIKRMRPFRRMPHLVKQLAKAFESENGNWLMHHAAQIYTRKIYVKLVGEWEEVYKWRVQEGERNHDWLYCHVKTRESVDAHPQHFVVQLSADLAHGTCACKSFEFSGLICKHIMKVFQRFDVEKIPEAFVCQRWRKGANRIFRATDSTQRLGSCYGDESEVFRLNHLCQEMTRLACLSAPNVEAYNVCLQGATALSKEVEGTISSVLGNRTASVVHSKVSSNVHEEIFSQSLLMDPNVSQTKGRKKGTDKGQSSGRIKSGIEITTGKNLRLCRSCKKMVRHDSRNCPENPNKGNKGPIESHIDEDDDDEDMEEDVDLSD